MADHLCLKRSVPKSMVVVPATGALELLFQAGWVPKQLLFQLERMSQLDCYNLDLHVDHPDKAAGVVADLIAAVVLEGKKMKDYYLKEMKVVIKAVEVHLIIENQEHEASANEADEKKAAWKVAKVAVAKVVEVAD